MKHTLAVDVWSVGLIIGEMLNITEEGPQPLIRANWEIEYLFRAMDLVGHPTTDDQIFFQQEDGRGNRVHRHFRGPIGNLKATIRSRLPFADDELHDVLCSMFQWNPNNRPEVDTMLKHSWFDSVRGDVPIMKPCRSVIM
ncbi:MAG: hypothetical protein KVP17_000302 [Porospora cf. gigantea B]|uniref:uncharacterized protein n=1 Tax=Porospora cf. gigantea B TaxID=2853592 RepID=UPI003571A1A4|nr:MAG: hypothetical protein KVP17_000302 [Porospora cf. gigantea B]